MYSSLPFLRVSVCHLLCKPSRVLWVSVFAVRFKERMSIAWPNRQQECKDSRTLTQLSPPFIWGQRETVFGSSQHWDDRSCRTDGYKDFNICFLEMKGHHGSKAAISLKRALKTQEPSSNFIHMLDWNLRVWPIAFGCLGTPVQSSAIVARPTLNSCEPHCSGATQSSRDRCRVLR